ncbi:hypothetical protein A4A49_18614 [Nicotiana attenuata]|uniref:Uncharacterized protein n=1 Tax=Nicotiana attenuata TaxID=49451 RepID=A0A314KHW3_NICAT|nr:hypothetical protein A4A49_18614 [Nicotiana attenuata]
MYASAPGFDTCLQHRILAKAIPIFTGGSPVRCVKIPQIPPAFVGLPSGTVRFHCIVCGAIRMPGVPTPSKRHINGSSTIKKEFHSVNEARDKNTKHHKIDNFLAMTQKDEKLLQRRLKCR